TNVNMKANTGFLIKNSNKIYFNNVQVDAKTSSAISADNVNYLDISGVKTFDPKAGVPLVELNNVKGAFIHDSFPIAGSDLFLKVKGSGSENIVVSNNNLSNVKKSIEKDADVK